MKTVAIELIHSGLCRRLILEHVTSKRPCAWHPTRCLYHNRPRTHFHPLPYLQQAAVVLYLKLAVVEAEHQLGEVAEEHVSGRGVPSQGW